MKQAGIIEQIVHVHVPSGLYRQCSGSGCVPGQELTQQHRTSPGLQWTEKRRYTCTYYIHVYISTTSNNVMVHAALGIILQGDCRRLLQYQCTSRKQARHHVQTY